MLSDFWKSQKPREWFFNDVWICFGLMTFFGLRDFLWKTFKISMFWLHHSHPSLQLSLMIFVGFLMTFIGFLMTWFFAVSKSQKWSACLAKQLEQDSQGYDSTQTAPPSFLLSLHLIVQRTIHVNLHLPFTFACVRDWSCCYSDPLLSSSFRSLTS